MNDFESDGTSLLSAKINKVKKGLSVSKEICVAILDTGCDTTHTFFEDICLKKYCVEGIDDCIDRCGHGTSSTSIIARYLKDVFEISFQLACIKISEQNIVSISKLNEGLKLCEQIKPDVIYLSTCNYSFNEQTSKLIYRLVRDNCIVVAPAGNISIDSAAYPASLPTVYSCGAAMSDGKKIANTNYVDGFISCTEISAILPKECSANMDIYIDEHGLCKQSGTSFTAAIFAAFSGFIKAYDKNVNVFDLQKISKKYSDDGVIKDYELIFWKLIHLNKKNRKRKTLLKNEYFVKIISPVSLDVNDIWQIGIYNLDGSLVTEKLTMSLIMYDDLYLSNIIYREQITYSGNVQEIRLQEDIPYGIHMINIVLNDNERNSISMLINQPPKPNLSVVQGMVIVEYVKETKVFYTNNGSPPTVNNDGLPIYPTILYENPIKYNKNLIFCAWKNQIFSKPGIVKDIEDVN